MVVYKLVLVLHLLLFFLLLHIFLKLWCMPNIFKNLRLQLVLLDAEMIFKSFAVLTLNVVLPATVIIDYVVPNIQSVDEISFVFLDILEVVFSNLEVLLLNNVCCFVLSELFLSSSLVCLFCCCDHFFFKLWIIHLFETLTFAVFKKFFLVHRRYRCSKFSKRLFMNHIWVILQILVLQKYLTFGAPGLFKLIHQQFLLLLFFQFRLWRMTMATIIIVWAIRFDIIKWYTFHRIIRNKLIFINLQLVVDLAGLPIS